MDDRRTDLLDRQQGWRVLSMKQRLSQQGFTLVEMMVVVAVLAVLMAIAVPNFRQWISKAQVRSKAESVLTGLQLARSEALKRNTAVSFKLSGDTSWSVGCLAVVADQNDDDIDECPAVIGAGKAKEGGTAVEAVASPDGSTEIIYNGMGRMRTTDAAGSGSAPISTIDIDATNQDAGSFALRLLVSGGGQIRLCDPAVTTEGDPRKC